MATNQDDRPRGTIPTPSELEQDETISTATKELRKAIRILRTESDRLYFTKLPKLGDSVGISNEINTLANQLVDVVRGLNGQEPIGSRDLRRLQERPS